MSLRIGMFRKAEDDSLEMLSEVDYEHYGVCPSVGDVIVWGYAGHSTVSYYEVTKRFFIDDLAFPGWAIIVSRVETTKLHLAVSGEWEISKEMDRQIAEEERGERGLSLHDLISRPHGERAKYPRLYPAETDYLPRRQFPPPSVESPIDPPLESWEKRALNALLKYKPNKPVQMRSVEGLGTATVKALLARGYIGMTEEGDGNQRRVLVWITKKAVADVKADKKFRSTYIVGV